MSNITAHAPSPHMWAPAHQRARAAVTPQASWTIEFVADLVQNRLQCAEFRTRSAAKTLFHVERVLVPSKHKISVKLYLSPSHLQSVGAQLGGLGDGQKIRKRTRIFMVRKAIPSIFPNFLELKPFLCRITVRAKKIWQMLEISCCRPLEWALDGIFLWFRHWEPAV